MAEVDWAAMLAAGDVSGFNEKRGERSRPELFAADLAEKSLVGVDLSNANLEKSDFTGTDLTDANLMRANMSGIDGTGAKLVDVIALRARFKEAWMDQTDLTGGDFAQASFNDANLSGSKGHLVRMSQARLRGVNAEKVSWTQADLSETKLHQGNFREADLQGADLTAASGAEIELSGARLDGVQANEAKFPGGRFISARLGQARLQRVNLSNADLTDADLSAADLSQANLSGANLTRANLTGAVLADANLEGAVLDGANFTSVDLSGIDPNELGLDDAAVAGLAAWGVAWDPEAPWWFKVVSVARRGTAIALAWINPEGPELRSARWAVLEGAKVHHGVVPIPADAVLDLQVAADDEGFVLAALRERPEGAVVSSFPIRGGELRPARSGRLGYDPSVKPVLRTVEGAVQMLGLARQGPTLVVTDLASEEPAPVASSKVATAQGFLRGQPVLACKGGVVIAVKGNRPMPPRRTPEGFPGLRGLVAAMPDEDVLLAAWVEPRVGERPGGLRTARIGPRHAPVAESVGRLAGVVALAAIQEGTSLRLLWAVAGDDGLGPTTLKTLELPSGEVQELDAPDDVIGIETSPGVAALVRHGGEITLIEPATGQILATPPSAPEG